MLFFYDFFYGSNLYFFLQTQKRTSADKYVCYYTNVFVIYLSVSLCLILPVHFTLLMRRVSSFVFLNVRLDTDVTSGLFRMSYLSIMLQISGYAAQSAFESYSLFLSFTSLALSCIDLSSTFPVVQLQHGSTSSGLDPSQLPRL